MLGGNKEHTVRTAHKKFLRRKLSSKPVEFQKSQKKDMSRNKRKLQETGGKYVSASERERLMGKGTISESKSNVRKVESDEEETDFECYEKSDGKPGQVNLGKKQPVDKQSLALLPNKSDWDEINDNVETGDVVDNISLQRSNRTFKPPERLASVPYS